MAKGLRNKTTKANKTKLRARVFTPAEKARLERLSAKQQELAKQPKPGNEAAPAGDAAGTMDLDNELSEAASTTARKEPDEEAMLLDSEAVPSSRSSSKSKSNRTGRIHKKHPRRRKPASQITFPSVMAHKNRMKGGGRKRR